METIQLPGALKVAVLIHSMGGKASRDILSQMGSDERAIIEKNISQIDDISPEVVERITQEFADLIERIRRGESLEDIIGASGQKGGGTQPLSAERSKKADATEAEGKDDEDDGLKALRAIEPEQLVEMIKDEHPQTISVIIVHLKPEAGSIVLSRLPDGQRIEVAMRIARMDKVLSGMIMEIDQVFEEVMKKKKTSATHKTGGVSHLAELLNMAEGAAGEIILSEIEEINADLAAQIKQMMFVFEDLVLVNDKGLQKVLRRVETQKLALALKGASEEVRRKIFKNMSERAGVMLREEIDAVGAVRMKDVEDAQQSITRIIQELEAKNEIIISGRKGGDYIA